MWTVIAGVFTGDGEKETTLEALLQHNQRLDAMIYGYSYPGSG
jgi:hypothetical protein